MILLKHAAKWKYSIRNTVTTFSINSYYVISYTEDLDTNASLSPGMMLQCHTEDFPIHLMTDWDRWLSNMQLIVLAAFGVVD